MSERLDYGGHDYEDEAQEKPGNGWTDGADPDVRAYREELRQMDHRFLEQLDARLDSGAREQLTNRESRDTSSTLREALDWAVLDDRQAAANAASWAVFQPLREDVESGRDFTIPDRVGPVEQHMLRQCVNWMQTEFATALGNGRADQQDAIDRMDWALERGITAAQGDVEIVSEEMAKIARETRK